MKTISHIYLLLCTTSRERKEEIDDMCIPKLRPFNEEDNRKARVGTEADSLKLLTVAEVLAVSL
jgi:hypothetical protein